MAPRNRYGAPAQVLHWSVAALIILQYVLANLAEAAEHADAPVTQLALLANHKSVGMTVLALAVIRLVWRRTHRPPPLPAAVPAWQARASAVTHTTMYVLIFAMPLSGWLMSSATAYSVAWFGLFQFPDLVAPDESLASGFETVHHSLAFVLLVLALVHVLAAAKHQLVDRDDVLRRMLSTPSALIFGGLLAAGLYALTNPGAHAGAGQTAGITAGQLPVASRSTPGAAVPTRVPAWRIDYAASHIRFRAEQAGATFQGGFRTWQGDVRFHESLLDASHARVSVDVASVETRDQERDQTLTGPAWFDAATYATAEYDASDFRAATGGFVAEGSLAIKAVAAPVPLSFTVRRDGESVVLDGRAIIDRTSFGLGTGEWSDPEAVGHTVTVTVHVEASQAPP